MKTWERPELSMVEVSNTEHDLYGENWDGGYVETIEGQPITDPLTMVIANAVSLGMGGDYQECSNDPADDVVNRRS